jgi:hypothetical protein
MVRTLSAAALVVAVGASFFPQRAEACGCFAPPDPTVPIVQAGERILFAVDNGKVTAHIQIQYAGDAKDFGWLLPLPSVPTLKLGTEELFTQLIATTQPRYFVNTVNNGNCGGLSPPAFASAGSEADSRNGNPSSPLVTQSSIGPYDYAVLRADSKDEMFNWLTANRYFIPTGTDQTVGPYIHPGAYFLALKLKSGKSAGDIQPVVLEYPSDLPMIPIILTSVAANPNMGIQVWMLGNGRAIPRNYNHVIVNDAQIDWLNQAQNYNDVVIRAISETPEKHAFVTEYAGTSTIMRNVLNPAGRFGFQTVLASMTTPESFVGYLFDNGYITQQNPNSFSFIAPTLLPQVKNLLVAGIPMPEAMKGKVSEDEFLGNLNLYLSAGYRLQNPDQFVGWQQTFDAGALAEQIFTAVVQPTLQAGELFNRFPTMTRLYTTLSPEDMTRDPVFSFNPSLPEVSRDHTATLRLECGVLAGNGSTAAATLITEQGWTFHLENRFANRDLNVGPAALRIETLREEGAPEVLTDNADLLKGKAGGCSVAGPESMLAALGLLALARRRRTVR